MEWPAPLRDRRSRPTALTAPLAVFFALVMLVLDRVFPQDPHVTDPHVTHVKSVVSRTWELVNQSLVILRSDKQLMLFPVFSAISCLLVTAIIATGGAAAPFLSPTFYCSRLRFGPSSLA